MYIEAPQVISMSLIFFEFSIPNYIKQVSMAAQNYLFYYMRLKVYVITI